ncbi:MAG: hypothetical protein D4R45_05860 [Planctomycetaceae bacterium]|nr:MAG: hypothetical protein D4R45_05860 [Planctomycetaceae bacterium]
MKNKTIFRIIVSFAFIIILTGCIAGNSNIQTPNDQSIQNGRITFGMIKKHIVRGSTNQEQVIKLFGSPDNMVMKKDKEIWIYDRHRVVSETKSDSSSGYGTIILFGRSAQTAKFEHSTSVRTLTVIVEFVNGIVSDYTMREGGY